MEVSVPARVLGLSLPEQGLRPYRVKLATPVPGSLIMADGNTLTVTHGLDLLTQAGTVIVPTWHLPGSGHQPDPQLLDALRAAHAGGALVAGLCLGAFVLGAAGLLDGRHATTHWAFAKQLSEACPAATIDASALYFDDESVLTSAGSAAGIDACLHLVRRFRGAQVANQVARALVVAPHRPGGQAQFISTPVPTTAGRDPITNAMSWLLANLDQPVAFDHLALEVGISRRTLFRGFHDRTGSSPLQWLIAQRVLRAQELLETTTASVDQIARLVGFATAVSLRPHFRRIVGVSPRDYRKVFAVV